MGMGIELIVIILASVFIGQWLDRKFNLGGMAMIFLSMAGLAGWITQVVVLAKKIEKQSDDGDLPS